MLSLDIALNRSMRSDTYFSARIPSYGEILCLFDTGHVYALYETSVHLYRGVT